MRLLRFTVLAVAVSLSGCAARVKTVTELPPGVTLKQAQDWDVAVQSLNRISTVTSTARTSVIELHTAGVLQDGPAYVTALQVVGKIDELQLSASAVLKQSPNNFTATTKQQVQTYVQQIGQQLIALDQTGVTGIKNPNSQNQIANLISQITALTGLILTL
jgi:hypothetical protein